MKLEIYNYRDLTLYLTDFVECKSQVNRGAYSFRAMAQKLENISHSQLYQIITGKKKFPIQLTSDFARKILRLDNLEKRYFKELVEISHLDDLEKYERLEQLEKLVPLEIQNWDENETLKTPVAMAIFETCGRSDILNRNQLNPQFFNNRFSEEEINNALSTLIETQNLSTQEDGTLTKSHDHLISKNDSTDLSVQKYHQTVSQWAQDSVSEIDITLREFQSYIINIDQSSLPKAKQLIRTFLSDFAKEMESQHGPHNATYNMNLQFFPITQEQK